MADTDTMAALIANSGKTDPKTFDSSGILDSYRKGQDWKYQQDQRNAFKDENGNFRQDLGGTEQGFFDRLARLAYAGSMN